MKKIASIHPGGPMIMKKWNLNILQLVSECVVVQAIEGIFHLRFFGHSLIVNTPLYFPLVFLDSLIPLIFLHPSPSYPTSQHIPQTPVLTVDLPKKAR